MKKTIVLIGMMMLMVSMVSATETIIDDFNRANADINGQTSTDGQTWTKDFGTAETLNNELYVDGGKATISTTGLINEGYKVSYDIKCTTHFCFVWYNDDFYLDMRSGDFSDLVCGDGGSVSITPSHDANKWYNIAIVYYYSNTSFDVYADDVYKGTCDVTTLTDVDTISFEHSYPFGSLYIDNLTIDDGVVTNTAPVINSISPSTRIELKSGESQSYSADVTDDEDDASYSWDLGGIEVSTSETYTANWDDIAAGIYTLTLTVDDGTYDDTESTTLEIRARGGSPSGTGAVVVTVEDEAVVDEDAGKIQPEQQSGFTRVINNIADYFVGLWERIFG